MHCQNGKTENCSTVIKNGAEKLSPNITMFPKSKNVINFGPGPAKIPEVVLERIQRELHEYDKTGISILELSHRSKHYDDLNNKLQKNIRDLANIPSNYQILLLQGGGTGQFAGVPLNLMHLCKKAKPDVQANADYMITGSWSLKAAKEAEKYLKVNKVIPMPSSKRYTTIPDDASWQLSKDAAYFYYCSNETIDGVEFRKIPEVPKHVPLVGDISSNAFSEPIDIGKHGLLFAGAQKNLGTAGVTISIVRDDLIGHADRSCPSILDYGTLQQSNSVYNTPPVFSIYVTNLVIEWIRDLGGLEEMKKRNDRKAELIYNVIDKHADFYRCPVDKHCRSRMNIPFRIGGNVASDGDANLEKMFLEEAEKNRNMVSLKGYRTLGGVRVSLYNAITIEEATILADFMEEFCDRHKK